ncbi:hypothetical protein ACOI1H_19990 [Loktanella sp. DJP18]|uniref:hypothetical protein n=1 Tax=Loktanella sp. DJP18 TaxID=3409788 RepID=UPI003BB55A78
MSHFVMPGLVDLVDVSHPDHLDWRQICLEIDAIHGRWFHVFVLDKDSGRDAEVLAIDDCIRASVCAALSQMAALAFPNRPDGLLNFKDALVSSAFLKRDDFGNPFLSFHVNAVSQAKIRALSKHEWLALTAAWQSIAAMQAARRAKPAI